MISHKVQKRAIPPVILIVLLLLSAQGEAGISFLNYNVQTLGYPGMETRDALQRIVNYLHADTVTFQEAKSSPGGRAGFLAANENYEGVFSTSDGSGLRQMIMSKYDIISGSVDEYDLGADSPRNLYAVTIDLPGNCPRPDGQ